MSCVTVMRLPLRGQRLQRACQTQQTPGCTCCTTTQVSASAGTCRRFARPDSTAQALQPSDTARQRKPHRAAELGVEDGHDRRDAREVAGLEEALEEGAEARDADAAGLALVEAAAQFGGDEVAVLRLARTHRGSEVIVPVRACMPDEWCGARVA
jgi:hypothetical protein